LWPRSKVLPSIVFFSSFSVRSSFNLFLFSLYIRERRDGKENKICLLSVSIVKWLSLSLSIFEQEEYWVALFQDNFIQSVGQCCIYFLCSLSRCKITTLYELSSSIMSIETQLCEYIDHISFVFQIIWLNLISFCHFNEHTQLSIV
jgi:hypothetical protein